MKRMLAWLSALMILISAAAGFAEAVGMPDLYELYDAADTGRTWIGTAVPIMDGVAVTSPVGLPERVSGLEIWDGTAYRTVSVALPVADGKILVLLHDTDGVKPAVPAYEYLQTGIVPQAGELMVRSGDWMRSRINRAVYDVSVITWNNREAFLLTLSGDTAPGSPVITADGKLAGIITAEYAEGANRYVALTVPEISAGLQEAAGILNGSVTDTRPEGYVVTTDENTVTFDWSGVQLPEIKEGEKLFHIIADAESSYLSYGEVTEGVTKMITLLTPGRTYISGLMACAGTPDELPEAIAVTSLPEAEPLTENEFKSILFTIGERPQDAPDGTMPTPAEQITEELLRSDRACFYSVSSYSVDQRTENISLLVSLTAPDGNNFMYESGWFYDPEIMEKDEWYTYLNGTGLLDLLNIDGYPEGTYELAMYVGGKLADSFSFELIK